MLVILSVERRISRAGSRDSSLDAQNDRSGGFVFFARCDDRAICWNQWSDGEWLGGPLWLPAIPL